MDVVKALRAFLISTANPPVAVAPYADLVNNVYTGPQEDLTQKAKYYIVIFSDYIPASEEFGDGLTRTIVRITLRLGYRTTAASTTGEKEAGDTFKYYIHNWLRSLAFRQWMESRDITVPANHIIRSWDNPFTMGTEALRRYFITMELVSYIDTYVT